MPKYTLVKTINADGKSPLFYFEGPSDATEPTDDWITDNSELLQKDTGVRKFKKGNTWEPIASSDGSGGSGGGQFVVTFGDVDFEKMTIGLPDKSGEEIHAALQANTPVVASLAGAIYLPLIQQNYESATAFSFTFAAAGEGLLAVSYDYDSSEKTGINLMIPASYTDLQELAPLIVNLTVDTTDPENPVIIGDKTYGEIFSAFSEGRDIRLLAAVDGSDIALTVLAAIRTGDSILLNRTDGNELLVNENGDSNEFFKFTEG